MKLKAGLAIAAVLAIFIGLMIYSSMGISTFRVEVCMGYQGRSACRTASGAAKDTALRAASDNACAQISSGMTDSMACGRSVPLSVKWLTAN